MSRLQQPAPVRHPLHADQRCTPMDPTRRNSPRDLRRVRRDVPRGARPAATLRVGAIGARPTASTPCASARSCWSAPASASRRSTCPKSSAASASWPTTTPPCEAKLASDSRSYVPTRAAFPTAALIKMAKLGVVHRRVDARRRSSTRRAIQCWTAMEEYFGVVPCTLMSMMSNNLMPSRLRDRHAAA